MQVAGSRGCDEAKLLLERSRGREPRLKPWMRVRVLQITIMIVMMMIMNRNRNNSFSVRKRVCSVPLARRSTPNGAGLDEAEPSKVIFHLQRALRLLVQNFFFASIWNGSTPVIAATLKRVIRQL